MSTPCNREACVLRLERIAASAKILADQMRKRDWYDNVREGAAHIQSDATYVYEAVLNDTGWAAGDR